MIRRILFIIMITLFAPASNADWSLCSSHLMWAKEDSLLRHYEKLIDYLGTQPGGQNQLKGLTVNPFVLGDATSATMLQIRDGLKLIDARAKHLAVEESKFKSIVEKKIAEVSVGVETAKIVKERVSHKPYIQKVEGYTSRSTDTPYGIFRSNPISTISVINPVTRVETYLRQDTKGRFVRNPVVDSTGRWASWIDKNSIFMADLSTLQSHEIKTDLSAENADLYSKNIIFYASVVDDGKTMLVIEGNEVGSPEWRVHKLDIATGKTTLLLSSNEVLVEKHLSGAIVNQDLSVIRINRDFNNGAEQAFLEITKSPNGNYVYHQRQAGSWRPQYTYKTGFIRSKDNELLFKGQDEATVLAHDEREIESLHFADNGKTIVVEWKGIGHWETATNEFVSYRFDEETLKLTRLGSVDSGEAKSILGHIELFRPMRDGKSLMFWGGDKNNQHRLVIIPVAETEY